MGASFPLSAGGKTGRRPGGSAAATGFARVFRLRRNGLRPPVPRT